MTEAAFKLDAKTVGDPVYESKVSHDRADIVNGQVIKAVRSQTLNIIVIDCLGRIGQFLGIVKQLPVSRRKICLPIICL